MCLRAANPVFMRENIKSPYCHHPATGRPVQLPHVLERVPKKFQVLRSDASVLREMRCEEPVATIQPVRNNGLAPHSSSGRLFIFVFTNFIAGVLKSNTSNRQV